MVSTLHTLSSGRQRNLRATRVQTVEEFPILSCWIQPPSSQTDVKGITVLVNPKWSTYLSLDLVASTKNHKCFLWIEVERRGQEHREKNICPREERLYTLWENRFDRDSNREKC